MTSALDFASSESFVEGEGDTCGRRIAVAIQMFNDACRIEFQRLSCRVQDSHVRLMQQPPIDLVESEFRGLDDFA